MMKRKVKAKAKKTAIRSAKKSVKKIAKAKPRSAPPAAKFDPLDSLILANAQTLRLPLDPAWRGGVKFNLQLILRLGSVVDDFALPDDAEPGPVFHA
jgi:Protein of unknown function (DUF4089)